MCRDEVRAQLIGRGRDEGGGRGHGIPSSRCWEVVVHAAALADPAFRIAPRRSSSANALSTSDARPPTAFLILLVEIRGFFSTCRITRASRDSSALPPSS